MLPLQIRSICTTRIPHPDSKFGKCFTQHPVHFRIIYNRTSIHEFSSVKFRRCKERGEKNYPLKQSIWNRWSVKWKDSKKKKKSSAYLFTSQKSNDGYQITQYADDHEQQTAHGGELK